MIYFIINSFPLGQVSFYIRRTSLLACGNSLLPTPSHPCSVGTVARCGVRSAYSCGAAPIFDRLPSSDGFDYGKVTYSDPVTGLGSPRISDLLNIDFAGALSEIQSRNSWIKWIHAGPIKNDDVHGECRKQHESNFNNTGRRYVRSFHLEYSWLRETAWNRFPL